MTHTPDAHELEYSPSSCIPSIDVELDRYRALSEAAARTLPHESVSYGELADERLILFESAAGAPLHIFIHGGYWQALSAEDSLFPAPALVAGGRSFAAVDYTLAPAATIGTMIDQCTRAVDTIVSQLRPSFVTLSGSSAGAHLAAHVAQRAGPPIDRLILLSGMFQLQPLIRTSVNDALGLDDEAAARWSVPLHPRPPGQIVVIHGRNETVAFKAQSARLASSWGVPVVEMDDRNHFDLVGDLAAIDLRLGASRPRSDEPTNPRSTADAHSAAAEAEAEPTEGLHQAVAVERPGAPRRLAPDVLRSAPAASRGTAASPSPSVDPTMVDAAHPDPLASRSEPT
jgi:arylformamidase